MGNSVSGESNCYNHRKNYSKHKRTNLLLDIPRKSFQFENIKSQSLASLRQHKDEGRLADFHIPLRNFIQHFSTFQFDSFLQKSLRLAQEEKSSVRIPTASTSPSTEGWNGQDFHTFEDNQSNVYAKSTPESQDLTASQALRRGDFIKAIIRFIETEIGRPDNFFFELADTFGTVFASKYKEDLKAFKKSAEGIEAEPETEAAKACHFRDDVKLKQKIQSRYQEAKKDLKEFRAFLDEILLDYIIKIYAMVNQEDTLVQKCDLERLSLKLLFGKSECYAIYFALIKYSVLEEEIMLKKTISKLENVTLEKFRIDSKFCLQEEEKPYHKVIESLRSLNVEKNPIDKFQMIFEVRKEILEAAQNYWDDEARKNETQGQLELTADDLMPIFCYCLANSGNYKVKRHQIFIEDFLCGDSVKFGESAYYFSTFIGAIDYLTSIAEDPLKKLEELD